MDKIATMVEEFVRKLLGLEHTVARAVADFQKAIDILQKAEDKASAKVSRIDDVLNKLSDAKNAQAAEAAEASRLKTKFTEFLAK